MKLLLALLALVAAPASATSLSISGWTANAGQNETFTISRSSGFGGVCAKFSTVDGTAKGGTDYVSTANTVCLGKKQSKTTITVATNVNELALGQTLSFSGVIKINNVTVSNAGAWIVEPSAPTPAPEPTGNPTTSTDTGGATAIPTTDFDISLAEQPSWGTGAIPVSAAPDVVGAFRFICGAGQISYNDPVVYPGQAGASHLHQFYGALNVDENSTYASLRATGDSTCNSDGAGHALNRSGYWMPALLDGTGYVIKPDYVSIYYKRRPATDPKCSLTSGDPQAEGNCVPIPNGIRFIFGYDMLSGEAPTGSFHFACVVNSVPTVTGSTLASIATAGCPVGAQIEAQINAPSCWDGHNLDSANHRDHVAYAGYGSWGYLKCPPDHPYVMPTFTLGAFYTIKSGDDLTKWSFSSDAMVPGAPAGTTFHADFFDAHDPIEKAEWTNGCINRMLNCSGGDMGDGKQLKGAQQPSYGWTNPSARVPVPSRP